MNYTILRLVFDEIKEKTNMNFAVIDGTAYGSTEQAIRHALADFYGENARGIWGRRSPDDIAKGKADVLYISPFNLSRDDLKDLIAYFWQMGYYATPCTGNYNLNGFFSIEEIPADKRMRMFFVETPIGVMKVRSKNGPDADEPYPGAWAELVSENGEESTLACVEYSPDEGDIAVDAYLDGDGDSVERHHVRNLSGAVLLEAKRLIKDFLAVNELSDEDDSVIFADLNKVPLAWTEVECVGGLHIQVYADLVDPAIVTCLQPWTGVDVVVSRNNYDTLAALNNEELDILGFDALVTITEDEWAEFRRSEKGRAWLKETFPAGTRIRLTEDLDDPQPIAAGTEGTVDHIDDIGTIHMKWDNGRSLGLVFAKDSFEIIGAAN